MADFEEQLNLLVKSGNKIYSPVDIGILGHYNLPMDKRCGNFL